jgi:hypothetical protein
MIYGFDAFFSLAGSHNGINMHERSPVLSWLAEGSAPLVHYEINGHPHNKCYYLADGIYPEWSSFVKIIREPTKKTNRRFAKQQEACMKDVERAFGVLQSRWTIVRHPPRTWSTETIWEDMTACVMMLNMIIEDERDEDLHEQEQEF